MSLDGSISQAMPPAGNGTPGYLTDQARGCRFNGWFWLHGHLIGTGFRHRLTLHGRLRGSLDEPQQRRDLGNGEVHRRQRPQRETLGAHCPGGLARKRRSRLRHHPAALGANLPDQRCQILDLQPCPRHGDRHAAASPCRGNLLADGPHLGAAPAVDGTCRGDACPTLRRRPGAGTAMHPASPVLHRRALARTSRSGFRTAPRRGVRVAPWVPVAQRPNPCRSNLCRRKLRLYRGLRTCHDRRMPARVVPAQQRRGRLKQRRLLDRPGRRQNRTGGQAGRPAQSGHRYGMGVRTAGHHRPGNHRRRFGGERRSAGGAAIGHGMILVHATFLRQTLPPRQGF